MADQIRKVRKTGFTLAPEAGTDRLRRVINKGNSEEDLERAVVAAFKAGWQSVKLYFMIGLPQETDEDLDAIASLIIKASKWARGGRITASVSTFVPKSHTPFQWAGQIFTDETRRRQQYIKRYLNNRKIRIKFHDPRVSFIEGVFARGDGALADATEAAFRRGARFDGWDDRLDMDLWMEAFQETGIDPNKYLEPRALEHPLPWDFVDSGVSKAYLLEEWKKSVCQDPTSDCRNGDCNGCGVCDFKYVYPRLLGSPDAEVWTVRQGARDAVPNGIRLRGVAVVPVAGDASPDKEPAPDGEACLSLHSASEEAGEKVDSPPCVPAHASEAVEQAAVRRFRLRYEKRGAMRFLGHQDVVRLFHRAFRRSRLVLDYSKGFHPHPKMRFSPPLGLGIESLAEYLDFDLINTDLSPAKVREALQAALPPGIEPVDLWETSLIARSLSGTIRQFIYEVTSLDSLSTAEIVERVRKFERSPTWLVSSVRKGRSRTRDLKDWVEGVECSGSVIRIALKSGQSGSVHPIEAASAILGLKKDEIRTATVMKTRVEFDETSSCGGKGLSDGQ